ncbi:hypothetical protein SAMN05443551_0921 [Marivita hallyeonensis]|uniref:Uncharacterized protein n=1 Tax=Marivita hallyeonensis TaxID=996342 RepID=A0A1M5NGZ4_9RHOB|nr:hypothetical protein SAMN05443551_0921 [Marivita hallyeonensis]
MRPEDKDFEYSWLEQFFRLQNIAPDLTQPSERPDFVAKIGELKVGIELTLAVHNNSAGSGFSPLQVARAQRDFDIALRDEVGDEAGVIISVSHNEGVPVSSDDWKMLKGLASQLRNQARLLQNPGALRFYSANSTRFRSVEPADAERVPLPNYMQSVGIYKDGDHDTKVGGGGGGSPPVLTDNVLNPILRAKSKAISGYRSCDQHWLLVVFDVMQVSANKDRKKGSSFPPSAYATQFSSVSVTTPVQTPFDRVFLLRWPSESIELPTYR